MVSYFVTNISAVGLYIQIVLNKCFKVYRVYITWNVPQYKKSYTYYYNETL